jgi:hypothetical protein
MRYTQYVNANLELAFCVLAQIWPKTGPDLAHEEIEICHVTNGLWPSFITEKVDSISLAEDLKQ